MLLTRLFIHILTDICNTVIERRLRCIYVDMEERCVYMEFCLYGSKGGDMVEVVETFKYPGRPLYQTDDNCSKIWQNIMSARTVWGRLGKLLRQGGAESRVLEMIYRALAQAVLLLERGLGEFWQKWRGR